MLDVSELENWPKEADVVILCKNNGYGLVPFTICLPHQVYKEKLKLPPGTSVTAIPVRSSEYIDILKE